jgi:uncharacterized protein
MLKAPVPGQVKTRLAASIGDEAACAAYQTMVEHQIRELPAHWQVEVHGTPMDQLEAMQAWLGPLREVSMVDQVSGDLGARMAAATRGAFERGAGAVVLLGGDSPWITKACLAELESALSAAPVAIIPALDGGYVALAMTEFVGALFVDMPWSQSSLMRATRARLTGHQICCVELRPLRDVDTVEDWELAQDFMAMHEAIASNENSSGLSHPG